MGKVRCNNCGKEYDEKKLFMTVTPIRIIALIVAKVDA